MDVYCAMDKCKHNKKDDAHNLCCCLPSVDLLPDDMKDQNGVLNCWQFAKKEEEQ